MLRRTLGTFLLGASVFCTHNLAPSLAEEEEATTPLVSSLDAPGVLPESLDREAHAAVERGLDWLTARQKPEGFWSNPSFPALTALASWPFVRANNPSSKQVRDKAIAYILSCAQQNGGIYKDVAGSKGGGLSNYNTAICMTVLHASGDPIHTPIVQAAREFLAGGQHFGDDVYNGGFGYDRSTGRAYTDLLNTFYAAQAMRLTQDVEDKRPAAQARADIDWSATVKFIERMQNKPESGDDAGGFVYNPTDPKAGASTNAEGVVVFRSYGSITYAGMLALIYADVSRDDVRVRSAFDWAAKHWTLDENPGMGAEGLYFFFNVLSRALDAYDYDLIPASSARAINWRTDVVRRLVALQKIDSSGGGYWVNDVGRYWESDPVLATAYTLLALQSALGD